MRTAGLCWGERSAAAVLAVAVALRATATRVVVVLVTTAVVVVTVAAVVVTIVAVRRGLRHTVLDRRHGLANHCVPFWIVQRHMALLLTLSYSAQLRFSRHTCSPD